MDDIWKLLDDFHIDKDNEDNKNNKDNNQINHSN